MCEKKNFFISYTNKDEQQALWIDKVLKKAGYTTIIQACDFEPGTSFTGNMHKALQNSERLIAVLSDDYFKSAMCNKEWENAFYKYCEDDRAIIPVRISNVKPVGVFTTIIYIDLYKIPEEDREKTLIAGIKGKSIKNAPDTSGIIRRREKYEIPLNNLPHSQNPYFTGRTEKMDLIYRNFQSGDVVSLIQSINGLGGVGKTSIALEYAYSHSHEYETIWWINSENRQTTFSSIRDFALLKGIITDDANEKDILEAMKYWFANNDRWLFIYDNADSGDFNLWLEKFLPKTRNGHVLITTRSNFFPKSESIDITVFTSTEAVLFLKKRTRKSGEGYSDDLAKKLSESLKYLPLALEQAAAYIVETPGVTYQDYIDLYERYGIEIFKKKHI